VASVSVVMGQALRMVLYTLVESFGIRRPLHYMEDTLLPYFRACGVEGGQSSSRSGLTKSDE